jgi:hypothetical protein
MRKFKNDKFSKNNLVKYSVFIILALKLVLDRLLLTIKNIDI